MLDAPPQGVTIHFSENVDPSASSIIVTGPSGTTVSQGDARTDSKDAHILSGPIKSDGNGDYIVNWSAVSADDGHFTKGAYPFMVGNVMTMPAGAMPMSSDVEIVEISTTPEALASAVELVGHGFLWAVLLLFAFAIRRLIQTGKFENVAAYVRRICQEFVWVGAFLVIVGAAAQIAIKGSQLAGLRSIGTLDALHIYLGTAAGAATALRIAAVVVFVITFFLARKQIFSSKKITIYEIGMFLCLCCFAYLRAKISHAASNPFQPAFSIFVNFFHVVEKDVWTGIIAMLLVLSISRSTRNFLSELMPRAFQMLAIDFALVSVTASYIIWLHLKSFTNLFTTQWGAALLELLLVATLLAIARSYHVFARIRWPKLFARALVATLSVECAFGILVIYCSSVIIITSPPLPQPDAKTFSARDQGMEITLARDDYEDGMVLLSDSIGSRSEKPVLTAQDESAASSPLSISLSQRFAGGYVFPESALGSAPLTKVSVTIPQSDAYDAHATFEIHRGDLDPKPGWESKRSFDLFSAVLSIFALLALLCAVPLYYFSGLSVPSVAPPHREFREFSLLGAFLIAMFSTSYLITTLHGSSIENPYLAECTSDGNMWHVMLPSVAGVPSSQSPAEGCMWGMGNYMYMYADKREYDYYSSRNNAPPGAFFRVY